MTTRRAWLLVAFLGVALFLNNCDRHTVFSLFPVLKSELNFSDVQLGLTGSIFLWVYALCNPISGQIGDRYSKRKLMAASLFLWSGVTALTGLSTSPWMLLVCRGLLGVTESLFMPSAMALLGTVHGPTTRSLATNLFGVGEYAGVAMGGWFGSFVAQEFHWRWVFFCLGLVGMLYSFPYFGFLKKVGETTPGESQPSSKGLSIAVLVKIRTYRFICLVFPICFCVFWLLYTWLPLFLYEKFSLSLAQAGFTATAYLQSANLIGSLSGAALADWLYARTKASRLWVSVAGFFLSAPCLYFIGNSPSLALTITAAVGFGLFGGWFIGNITVASFDVVPAHTRASAYGCLNLTGSLVTGFASLLEGKLKQSLGIANMMSLAAIACVTAGVLVMVCIRFYFYSDHERMVCRDSAKIAAPC